MWVAIGIAVGMGIAVLFLALRYRMLQKCVRQASLDMEEILDSPQENRILRISTPSREAERLLEQINRYIQYHQRERIDWQRQERQLQEQIENISHDLRTPLTAILGYLELVDGSGLSEADKEALAVVERRSRYLQRLICDFYDLSRLERKNVQLQHRPVEITRLVRETMLSYSPEFEEQRLAVELSLPETAVTVLGDREALERILHNLVQNALRYARSRFWICVRKASSTEGESRVFLEFCNDTDSLTQADIPFLFERFYTADHARPSGSTGLGLTVSKLLAQAMGGAAWAELTEQGDLRLTFMFTPS
ncbi:MAG: HAMP domain-containing histidine kinase [Acetatifactor sp.]|nr:HAMP domain-containing histidine kinase [Acetatifactor sp.]